MLIIMAVANRTRFFANMLKIYFGISQFFRRLWTSFRFLYSLIQGILKSFLYPFGVLLSLRKGQERKGS